MSKRNKVLMGAVMAVAVTGCAEADYFNHRDTVTTGAGDAMEANTGIHTRRAFPGEAWDTKIPGDGERIYRTMRGYKGRPAAPGTAAPGTAATGGTPMAGGGAAPPPTGSPTTTP